MIWGLMRDGIMRSGLRFMLLRWDRGEWVLWMLYMVLVDEIKQCGSLEVNAGRTDQRKS